MKSNPNAVIIPLSQIVLLDNSRAQIRDNEIQGLMSSIKNRGLINPLEVERMEDGKYALVSGFRRYTAMQKLDWFDAPCTVKEFKNNQDRDANNLEENIHRKDLSAWEEGRIYSRAIKKGLSIAECAIRFSVGRRRVMTAVDIFSKTPQEFREDITFDIRKGPQKQGKISVGVVQDLINMREGGQALTKDQMRDVLNIAKKGEYNKQRIKKISGLLMNGMSIEKAAKSAMDYKIVMLKVSTDMGSFKRIQKKYGKSYGTVLIEYLQNKKEFGIHKKANKNPKYKEIRVGDDI